MAATFGISFAALLFCVSVLFSPTWCDKSETPDDCQGKENSYLWKIDVSPPIYLFGTMHVPYTKLWEYIPENTKVAFSASEDLCIELRLSDDSTVNELSNCQRLPKDVTIDQLLSYEVRKRIRNYLERIRQLLPNWLQISGLSSVFGGGRAAYSDNLFNAMVGDWESKRPIWILYMLSSLTEENIRLRKIPLLDLFMDNAAQKMGKRVQAVETAKDQCRPLNKLSNEQVELALRVQLDYLEPMVSESSPGPVASNEGNIHTYRCGDFASLVSSTPFLPLPSMDNINSTSSWLTTQQIAMLKNTESYLWGQMVTRRNRKMTKAIHALLQNERNLTYFFALGAGHFLSDRNVIDRLKRKGYTVQHIPVTQHLDGPSLPNNILELGHPDLVPQLMPILPEDKDNNGAAGLLPTLSDETLAEIWKKYVNNARQILSSSIAPSFTTTTTTQSPLKTRNTRSQSAEAPKRDLSVSEIEDEMWQRELSELFLFSNSESGVNTNSKFSDYSNSAHCSLSKMHILSLLLLTGLLSLILSFALSQ